MERPISSSGRLLVDDGLSYLMDDLLWGDVVDADLGRHYEDVLTRHIEPRWTETVPVQNRAWNQR